ncbi:MAG: hypothetical protein DSZ08_02920 [Sulfurovum sp.]|nr:MAG: hypothetical protein DSZ08_02920 [Sulfurovum sp.]
MWGCVRWSCGFLPYLDGYCPLGLDLKPIDGGLYPDPEVEVSGVLGSYGYGLGNPPAPPHGRELKGGCFQLKEVVFREVERNLKGVGEGVGEGELDEGFKVFSQ